VLIVERRGAGKADVTDDQSKHLIFTPMRSQPDTDTSLHAPETSDSKSRPVPKPRAASTSSTLDTAGGFADLGAPQNTSLDQSLESDVVRPRPRARESQEQLNRPATRGSQEQLNRPATRGSQEALSKPQPQQRPRTRGSQESLDDNRRPVPRANPRGSVDSLERVMDQRPTPALRGSQESLDRLRGSQESLDRLGRPQPRARGSLDRSLDESDVSAPSKPNRPQVAIKANKKPATSRKDRAMSSDETDV